MTSTIEIFKGDITKLEVDAIVNAANTSLLGGGGIDGAIHRAAGKDLEFECRMLGGCKPGQAKLTKGYDLPASHIIHTVGPVWQDGRKGEPEILKSCYENSLHIVRKQGFSSVAFPCISTGIYKFPKIKAARIAWETVSEFVISGASPEKIVFCCYLKEDAEIYRSLEQENLYVD